MLACRSVNWSTGQNTWYRYAGYEEFPDLPHMPAHSRQSGRQNIIARTHTWQRCSVSTSGAILTTKYGFNLRQNSPPNIENNMGSTGPLSDLRYSLFRQTKEWRQAAEPA